jgi:HigB_toxin, RelE-like toxic component of a toxin-antitoxin system
MHVITRKRLNEFTIFNVAGNKARLIAAIHYNRNKIYIRHVLTHQEYDTGNWKEYMSVAELENVTKAWPLNIARRPGASH